MTVLGLGTDIVQVARIAGLLERHGDRFLQRIYREGERAAAARRRGPAVAAALAARWAAKEAFVKALGSHAAGVPYRDVEVIRHADGAPSLQLHARAAEALARAGGRRALVSLSHERDVATATVILCG